MRGSVRQLFCFDLNASRAILVVGALSVSQIWAAQPLDQLLACRHVPDSAARLECFDRAADAAGATKPRQGEAPPADRSTVESSVVSISQPLMGRAEFTLENGQVWRQMDPENAKSAKIGDRVVVSKKALGAHWLQIEGGRAWRVSLVR